MQQTSIAAYAAAENSGLLGQLQLEVLKVIVENGPLTQGETWSEFFLEKRQRHDVCPRFAELVKKGVIANVGTRKCRYTGVEGNIYIATGQVPNKLEKMKTKKQRLIDAETFIEKSGLGEAYLKLTGNKVNGGK